MGFYFEQPIWFLLLPLLLVSSLIIKRYWNIKSDKHSLTSIYLPSLFATYTLLSSPPRKARHVWCWVIIILMTSALAQPVTKIKKKSTPDTLKDIIFIVDTSVGMSISDYVLDGVSVSRLSLLKAVLTDFIPQLSGNRIGLMVYADHAYALSPLTRDKNLVSYSIDRIQPAIAGRQNNISNALNSALKQYDFKTSTPSVVLLSQGSNIDGNIDPIEIIKKFKIQNIKIHVIGLGSNKPTNNNSNKLIFDSIDDKFLKQISGTTKGEFFWAGKSDNLNSILQTIMQSESIEVKNTDYYLLENYYVTLLGSALFILLLLLFKSVILSRKT